MNNKNQSISGQVMEDSPVIYAGVSDMCKAVAVLLILGSIILIRFL